MGLGWVAFCLQAGVSSFLRSFKGLPKCRALPGWGSAWLPFLPGHLWPPVSTSRTFWWLAGLLLLSKQRRQSYSLSRKDSS